MTSRRDNWLLRLRRRWWWRRWMRMRQTRPSGRKKRPTIHCSPLASNLLRLSMGPNFSSGFLLRFGTAPNSHLRQRMGGFSMLPGFILCLCTCLQKRMHRSEVCGILTIHLCLRHRRRLVHSLGRRSFSFQPRLKPITNPLPSHTEVIRVLLPILMDVKRLAEKLGPVEEL